MSADQGLGAATDPPDLALSFSQDVLALASWRLHSQTILTIWDLETPVLYER